MWANEPWPCGAYSDVRVFRNGLKKLLRKEEFVITDAGYTDERCIQPPGVHHQNHGLMATIRARHEIFNKRLKQFDVLKHKLGHDISLHRYCFFAVLNVTQMMMQDEPLFATDY